MDALLKFFEIGAVVAAAVSGGLDARRKNMDFIGVYFIALATALGGGSARDALLGRFPVFWVKDAAYPLYVLASAAIVALFYKRNILEKKHVNFFIILFDAIGLGLFSMVGASYAMQSGSPFFSAILIGVVNGIFGGILRDVLCNEIPSVFTPSPHLYATCSFLGCTAYLGLFHLGLSQPQAFAAGTLVAIAIRIIALRFRIGLPF